MRDTELKLTPAISLILKIELCCQKILIDKSCIKNLQEIKKCSSKLRKKLKNNQEAYSDLKKCIDWINLILNYKHRELLTFPLPEITVAPNLHLYGIRLSKIIQNKNICFYLSDMLAVLIQFLLDVSHCSIPKLALKKDRKNQECFSELEKNLQNFLKIANIKMLTYIQNDQFLHKEILDFFNFTKIKHQKADTKRYVEEIKLMIKNAFTESVDISTLNLMPFTSAVDQGPDSLFKQVLFRPQFLAVKILQLSSYIMASKNGERISINSATPPPEISQFFPIYQKLLKIKEEMAPYFSQGKETIWQAEPYVIPEKNTVIEVARMTAGFPFKPEQNTDCMAKLQKKVKDETDVDILFYKKNLKNGGIIWFPQVKLKDYPSQPIIQRKSVKNTISTSSISKSNSTLLSPPPIISSATPVPESSPYFPIYQKLLKIKKEMGPYLLPEKQLAWQVKSYVMPNTKTTIEVARMSSGFSFTPEQKTDCMTKLQKKVKDATCVEVIFYKRKLKSGETMWIPQVILKDYPSEPLDSTNISVEKTKSARFFNNSTSISLSSPTPISTNFKSTI